MGLPGTSSAATSAPFLTQLRANHAAPRISIWDNSPVHGGEAMRTYLETPDLDMQVCRLPAYSPDFNADEAIWAWVREDVTANTCLGTTSAVQEMVAHFFDGLKSRPEEGKTRCRTKLQKLAEALPAAAAEAPAGAGHVVLTCASV
ncbi:MAG TPA: transposase [Herpetosiphonaceae bacterium]|nr:transposase [Herpetosiphonaceae bacterium]